MSSGAVIGGIAGLIVGWVISAAKSKFTYLGGGYGQFEGMGCGASIALYLVCAVIGAILGGMFLQ